MERDQSGEDCSSDDGYNPDIPEERHAAPKKSAKRKIPEIGPHAVKVKRMKGPRVPLTAEELIYLKETENLFQSSVFRLQLSELLNEVKPKKSSSGHFEDWFKSFTKLMAEAEDSEEAEFKTCVQALAKHGVRYPLSRFDELSGTFRFSKPVKTQIVGSYGCGTSFGPLTTVEIALVMPKKTFRKSDKLDSVYFAKKALYLCEVAARLLKSDLLPSATALEFTSDVGGSLKPHLVLRLVNSGSIALEVLISALPESGTFKRTKFSPDRNNLTTQAHHHADEHHSTPHYNAMICEDLVMEENEVLRKSVFQNNNHLRDAAVFLGIWLKQRNMSEGLGSFNMDIVTMYLVYMVRERRINLNMSSNQILRAFWLELSKGDWTLDGPSLCKTPPSLALPPKSLFHSHHEVVFVDATGFHNLAFKMNWTTFAKVKNEAGHAIKLLNRADSSSFQALFLKNTPFLHQYDNVLCFQGSEALLRSVESHAPAFLREDLFGQLILLLSRLLLRLLPKGLGPRLDAMGLSFQPECRWCLNDRPPSNLHFVAPLMIGLKFNAESSLSIIDKGPPPNSTEGAEFREFWAGKCQSRRFKDGSTLECVVWGESTSPISSRREIVKTIIIHLLKSKLGISEYSYRYIGFELSPLTRLNFAARRSIEESSSALHKTFARISQELHDLSLPLEVVSVHCVAESYRFTDPFPPIKSHFKFASAHCQEARKGLMLNSQQPVLPPYTPIVDVVVQMSMSGKWPKEHSACKRLVAAFYVAIAEAFTQKKHLRTQVTSDFVVILKEGFLFRLFLTYPKEIGILKEQTSELGLKLYRNTDESKAVEQQFVHLPRLVGALYGLSQTRLGYSPTVVLAKRWLSSQLMHDTHFPTIVVELLVAHQFMSAQPVESTMHAQAMFLRFLRTLSTTNWHLEPIIVNFNDAIDKAAIEEAERKFSSQRDSFPPIFLVTPFDTSGEVWTRRAPTVPVLVRVAKLAAVSLQIIEAELLTNDTATLLRIFEAPMSIYDFVIRVDLRAVTRRYQHPNFNGSLLLKSAKSRLKIPVGSFDPMALYVQRLEENYGSRALFFYDKYGGSEIGVLLKPQQSATTPLEVSRRGERGPAAENGGQVTAVDLDCIADGFKITGFGLVVDVAVNHKK